MCVAISNRHSVRTAVLPPSVKPGDTPVVLGVTEYRFDHLFAFSVEPIAEFARQHVSHPRVTPAGLARPRRLADAGVRRDQHLHVLVGDHLVHVLLIAVLGVGDRGLQPAGHARAFELADRRRDHRSQL